MHTLTVCKGDRVTSGLPMNPLSVLVSTLLVVIDLSDCEIHCIPVS